MTTKISESVLLQFSEFVASHLGLHFPSDRWLDLQRAVGAAAQECGFQQHDLDCYIQGLLSLAFTQNQLEVLASHLTVGETYFFREKRSLEIFEERILPELVRARAGLGAPIRIWSAGCATGEEPYSVAIMLTRLMAGLTNWNLEILATDVNTKSLQKASEGTYGAWSFRGTPAWVRHTCFEAGEEGRCTIDPAIKKMVRFAQLNLMDDAYPASVHLRDHPTKLGHRGFRPSTAGHHADCGRGGLSADTEHRQLSDKAAGVSCLSLRLVTTNFRPTCLPLENCNMGILPGGIVPFLLSDGRYRSSLRFRDSYRQTPFSVLTSKSSGNRKLADEQCGSNSRRSPKSSELAAE